MILNFFGLIEGSGSGSDTIGSGSAKLLILDPDGEKTYPGSRDAKDSGTG